ncbi:hypothetical protein FB467_0318 [Ornithinicoccus hortensis]|uniref:GT2 family glycosyltransferase n=2 Tax=Ornithinicoccus hortensis TaxID=82346 RepID=A0A542YME8_9MICO|nr:hypothetical protein FB467_0318 [Ornithinicoccus hortensis]
MTTDRMTTARERGRVAVITAVSGQHDELMGHVGGIAVGSRVPDLHVVIGMADPDVSRGRLPITSDRWRTITRAAQTTDPARLPLAAARNLGATVAMDAGADVLIFVSVRCIPGPRLVERYADLVGTADHTAPVLWCGEVRELPPPSPVIGYPVYRLEPQAVDVEPLLPEGYREVEVASRAVFGDSFALTAEGFRGTGGFCPRFRGAEGVDEDFARVVSSAGGTVVRVGGVPAYRQFRPAASPGEGDVHRLVRNANVFAERWGRTMSIEEWEALVATGVAQRDEKRGRWVVA